MVENLCVLMSELGQSRRKGHPVVCLVFPSGGIRRTFTEPSLRSGVS